MADIPYIKLSDLTRRIQQVIQQAFSEQTYWVVAEISGHKFYPDQDRHYFDLVEKMENSSTEAAKVKANAWTYGAQQISQFEHVTGQRFGDGLQVLVCVRVNYHIVYGLSLTLTAIDSDFTLGNLERQRRQTLERLVNENQDFIQLVNGQYVTRNKSLRMNSVIQQIALVGSPKSEGYTDFVHTMTSNNYGYRFRIDNFYTSVQGVNAEQELVKTLVKVYEMDKTRHYDCVVITRGGGAKTDFLVFDTYNLARVAAKFPIPVITGIGHHKDVSIVDMMVHTQTKTPTKAAEFIIAHNRNFEENVLGMRNRIVIRGQQLLADRTRKINRMQAFLTGFVPNLVRAKSDALLRIANVITNRPVTMINQRSNALLKLQQNITSCAKEALGQHHRKMDALYHQLSAKPREIIAARSTDMGTVADYIRIHSRNFLNHQKNYLHQQQTLMRMMSPQNILKKGFAIVSQNDKIVTRAQDVVIGSPVTITMDKLDLHGTIQSKTENDGKYDV